MNPVQNLPWLRLALVVCWLMPLTAPQLCVATETDARSRLARMHAAANERNYQGTMVFTAAGVVSSSRVAHFCVGDQNFERIEALDGRMQKIYRHNETVHTLWPQSNVAVVDRREALGAKMLLVPTVEPRALDQYALQAEGRERIAGREAEVFLLQPRDDLRFAQRLWADLATGLMLRADIVGPGKSVLESSAFSEIEIGIKPQPESVLQPVRKLTGYKVLRAQFERTQLEAEGWTLSRPLPGFGLTSCVKRPLEALAAADGRNTEPVLQTVFFDGLTHVSLFIERFDATRHRKVVQAQLGATSTLMERRGEFWLTAMGDVPAPTLRKLLDALVRR